jgi:O-antigen biosynthesis protein WbqP
MLGIYKNGGKRILDLTIATMGLLLFIPFFTVIGIVIGIFDPGPVMFSQERIGRDGKSFRFFKFRSMPVGTGDIPSDALAVVKLTWVGKVIRRTNIDELPQLLNVLCGDMSIVGPRPPIAVQTELINLRRSGGALACRPGLTGLAQIRSFDGMSVGDKCRFDVEYASEITLRKDLAIILATFAYLTKPPPRY